MAMGFFNACFRADGLYYEEMDHIMLAHKRIQDVKRLKDGDFSPYTLKGSKSSSNLSESL